MQRNTCFGSLLHRMKMDLFSFHRAKRWDGFRRTSETNPELEDDRSWHVARFKCAMVSSIFLVSSNIAGMIGAKVTSRSVHRRQIEDQEQIFYSRHLVGQGYKWRISELVRYCCSRIPSVFHTIFEIVCVFDQVTIFCCRLDIHSKPICWHCFMLMHDKTTQGWASLINVLVQGTTRENAAVLHTLSRTLWLKEWKQTLW